MALSKSDFSKFEELITNKLDEVFERRLGLESGETLMDKLKYLPTKDEFYKKEDEVLGEIQKLRDEVAVTTHQYQRTNMRVDLIDKRLGVHTSDLA